MSRPPPAARRDPRADPDDEPISERVDVVTVDRGRDNSTIDSLTNAALTLRRELAKLHQQAAAVERTIEDQRRERSDALERAEQYSSKISDLEAKGQAADAELEKVRALHEQTLTDMQSLRNERDDLVRAVDSAKEQLADVAKVREDLATVRKEKEDIARSAATFEAEIGEIRKREQAGIQKASDVETELQSLRQRFERTTAELQQAREDISAAKAETLKGKNEASEAASEAARKLSESEHERLAAKEQVNRLETQLTTMRAIEAKVVKLDADLTNARMELVHGRSEIGRLERDIEDIRHARDVATERAGMAEKEVADVRKEIKQVQSSLVETTNQATAASLRALNAERARTSSEESVRTLRDEITTAFARWRSATPSVIPPNLSAGGSVAPPTRAVPLAELAIPAPAPIPRESAVPTPPKPEEKAEEKLAGSTAITSPPSAQMAAPTPAFPEDAETRPVLDDEWTTPSNPPPPIRTATKPPSVKLPSVPPAIPTPPSASVRASKVPSSRKMPSVPPVPPETKKSLPPTPSKVPIPPSPSKFPPAVTVQTTASIPPVMYPSVPPPQPMVPPPAPSTSPTAPPPARAEESSIVTYVSQEREDLVERLGSPKTSREAARTLRDHPEWLRGRPPIELLLALTLLDYDIEEPVFELARGWDRDPLCRALVAALRDEPDAKLREHGAWLLKHLGAASSWPAIAELVANEDEAPAVRRWLLEAVERLVATRSIGWDQAGELCQRMARHPNASLREGAIGVVAALDRSDDKRRLLLDVLRTDHDEVVLSSAVHALTTALPIELDPSVAERLLGHPSPRVQQSVVEFIERSKRAAKSS
jgi:hypothetical protein